MAIIEAAGNTACDKFILSCFSSLKEHSVLIFLLFLLQGKVFKNSTIVSFALHFT